MTRKNCRILAIIALLLSFVMLLTGCQGLFEKLGLEEAPTAEATYEQTQPAQETEPPTTEPEIETIPVQTLPPETEPPVVYYWVQAEGGLNVRSGPGQNYETVGRLDNGAQIYPERWQNGWAYITTPVVGWCSGEYLHEIKPDYLGDGTARWVHTNGLMKLYDGPGTGYQIIGQLDAGVTVYPIRWEGNWAYITINDYYTGWCRADHLSEYDPFPEQIGWNLVTARAPANASLVGNWGVITDYAEYGKNDKRCRAGILQLRTDGTFTQEMGEYMSNYGYGWYCPGGETSGVDSPYWVGDYTYDGKTLVLNYRGEYQSEYIYDETGFPMPLEYHWNKVQKQVVLQVTVCSDGFMVNAPQNIPVFTYNAQGSANTSKVLYSVGNGMDYYGDISTLLDRLYP